MGGRGASFGAETIQTIGGNEGDTSVEPLIVAGMTPVDAGSRFTNAVKTLEFIEGKKKDYEKEQLQVIDDFGYVTRAFQGNKHSVGIDADTKKYMRGKIVTHNHPDSYGGTFSDADILMLSSGVKEMRASAKEGIYSIKAMDSPRPEDFYNNYLRAAPKLQHEMREISLGIAGRKWGSYDAYRKASRREQLKVIDSWYRKNAPEYGYQYSFTQNEDYR